MRNILLLCNAGMSTSILMQKIREYAEQIDYALEVSAHSVSSIEEHGDEADVILIGPQIRYQLGKVKGLFPEKPVEGIDMVAYGTMDGKKVVEQIKQLLGDE